MINIGKKDAIYSYLSYIVTMISKIIVIPIVLRMVSSEEYALWSVFISIEGITSLFDMGVAKLVARYATYAYCGADKITIKGLPTKSGDKNYNLFFDVYYVAKGFYKKIAYLTLAMMTIASFYIYHLAKKQGNIADTMLAWAIFTFGIVFQIYFTYLSSFLKGMGKIKENQQISIYGSIVEIIAKLALVCTGFGLVGLGIANCIVVIFQRVGLNTVFNRETKSYHNEKELACIRWKNGNDKEVSQAFKVNSLQLGSVVAAQYILGQGTVLICSLIFTLAETAEYSLTTQLYGVVQSVANIPFQVLQPKLNEYRLNGEKEKIKDVYSAMALYTFLLYVIGIILISFSADPVLGILKSNTSVLPYYLSIIFGINQFIINNHQRCTNIIGLGNEQPFTKAYIITIAVTLCYDVIVYFYGLGILGFLLGNLMIQLAYNGWRWPQYVHKLFDISTWEIPQRAVKWIIRVL